LAEQGKHGLFRAGQCSPQGKLCIVGEKRERAAFCHVPEYESARILALIYERARKCEQSIVILSPHHNCSQGGLWLETAKNAHFSLVV